MPRGGRKIRGNYQWLPCVKAYLATTFPEWVSYSEIITNTELLSPTANYRYLIKSKICPSHRKFVMCLRGNEEIENRLNDNNIRLWRLKVNVSNRRTN